MARNHAVRNRDARIGSLLVEISVVVVIIGVIAAYGLPRVLQSVERKKAAESFKYLVGFHTAQERYRLEHGEYSTDPMLLDLEQTQPAYFSVGEITVGTSNGDADTWSLTLTRAGGSNAYGDYTVTFTEQGYDVLNSTIEPEIIPPSTEVSRPRFGLTPRRM